MAQVQRRLLYIRSQYTVYKLIDVLHIEAIDVEYVRRFVTEKLMLRFQRKKYARLHDRIFGLWEKFGEGELSAKQLLRECACFVRPVMFRFRPVMLNNDILTRIINGWDTTMIVNYDVL
jgi:hypothetical protein